MSQLSGIIQSNKGRFYRPDGLEEDPPHIHTIGASSTIPPGLREWILNNVFPTVVVTNEGEIVYADEGGSPLFGISDNIA